MSRILSFLFWMRCTNENSSQQAAALVYSVIFSPISHGRCAHRTKATELLNFNVVGARSF